MSENSKASNWPRLKLRLLPGRPDVVAHPELDWVEPELKAEDVGKLADAVEHLRHPLYAPDGSGPWIDALLELLRALAASKAALKALNHRQKTPPARVVNLNRAVHVYVKHEMAGALIKTAYANVAKEWGLTKPGQVAKDCSDHSLDRSEAHPLGDPNVRHEHGRLNAAYFAEAIVRHVCNERRRSGGPRQSRAEVLEDFDADMRDRGATEIAVKQRAKQHAAQFK